MLTKIWPDGGDRIGANEPMRITLADHIAQFNGRKVKFLERKFLKHLRKTRETVKRSRTVNKQLAID